MADDRARGGRRDAETLRAARATRPTQNAAAQATLSGEAWHRYCDALREAGDHLMRANAGATATTRAEGFRYLLSLVRGGIGQALELANPLQPRFFRNPDSNSRWGAENADNQYLWARVDPGAHYRIRGERGTAFDFLIEVKEGYMQLGDEQNFATLTADEIHCDDDGLFEIAVSREPRTGNWLPLDPAARYIAVRQYLCDWGSERPARFTIECDGEPNAEAMTPARMAELLQDAGEWTLESARFWSEWTEQLREAWVPDRIAPARKFAGGADDIYYGNDFYRLGSNEALLVANWLDTAGEPEGLLQYRWIWPQSNPCPQPRIVPFDEIRAWLPAETPEFGRSERRAQLRIRQQHRAIREPEG